MSFERSEHRSAAAEARARASADLVLSLAKRSMAEDNLLIMIATSGRSLSADE